MAVLGRYATSASMAGSRRAPRTNDWRATASTEDLILEAWGEGFVVGALLIMVCLTVANMRRGVFLHKLILAELLFAMSHGTFCFMTFDGYGWYLSSTAALYYISSWLHNLVAWLKIRPFFRGSNAIFSAKTSKTITWVYLITLGLSAGPLVFQISNNFRFFNDINSRLYPAVRPYETLMRDPWWVFVCIMLFRVVRKCYGATTLDLLKSSPRFGVLVAAIVLAVIFTIVDIVASVHPLWFGATNGINPWWKMYLVFKCLTDTIMLDDFKTELDRLSVRFTSQHMSSISHPAGYKRDDDEFALNVPADKEQPNALEFLTEAPAASSGESAMKAPSYAHRSPGKGHAESMQIEHAS